MILVVLRNGGALGEWIEEEIEMRSKEQKIRACLVVDGLRMTLYGQEPTGLNVLS